MSEPADRTTTGADFFDAMYRAEADPWNFRGSPYEQGKYETTVKALRGKRYRNAFEPGCSVGALTAKLAPLCDHIEAIDFSPAAIATARQQCRSPNVTFRICSLPDRLPVRGFDLLVLSEIGYYFEPDEWQRIATAIADEADADSTILAVHWLGSSPDHRMSGDTVHAILHTLPNLHLLHTERHELFRLDRWVKIGTGS